MAKMFYSVEEAAAKLRMTPDQVRDLAAKGQLQEFRDRDELMSKVEQVDLLAAGKRGDDSGIIPLAGSGELEPISLASSGTGVGVESPKEQTGISIFDAETTEEADPSAVTRVTASGGSGSGGLLDLTKESDDSAMGAGALGEVYGSETVAARTTEQTAMGGEGGAMFEAPGGGAEVESAAAPMMMAVAEAYDGAGSGFVGGLSLGIVASLLLASFAALLGITGAAGGSLLNSLGDSLWIAVGAVAGVTLLGAARVRHREAVLTSDPNAVRRANAGDGLPANEFVPAPGSLEAEEQRRAGVDRSRHGPVIDAERRRHHPAHPRAPARARRRPRSRRPRRAVRFPDHAPRPARRSRR